MSTAAKGLVCKLAETDEGKRLLCPGVGRYRPLAPAGLLLRGGELLGELLVLGERVPLTAPPGVRGVLRGGDALESEARWIAVDYGSPLYRLERETVGDDEAEEEAVAPAEGGEAYRAPLAGRFYRRPAPGEPPFVDEGQTLETGRTLCLLEVMKTFNRVVYEGPPMRVTQVAVEEGADVDEGDTLFRLEPV